MNNLKTLIKQGLGYPSHFIKGRIQKSDISVGELHKGEGAIVEKDRKKVAAFKDLQGKLILLSPVCKHLGCIVNWNKEDKTWDCPCHGSRYEANGNVKHGPTTKPLDKIS